MPDAVGALAQQQGIAAQIPYKNILLPNPATQFLNAFQLGVEINRKRQMMEKQMEQLVLQNERLNLQDQWKSKEFEYKYDALKQAGDLRGQALGIQEQRLGLATDKVQRAMEEHSRNLERGGELESRIGNIDKPPGSAAWWLDANKIRNEFTDYLATKDGQQYWNNLTRSYNNVAKEKLSAANEAIKMYNLARQDANGVSPYFLGQPAKAWGEMDDPTQPSGKKSFIPYDAKGAPIPYRKDGKYDTPPAGWFSVDSKKLEHARGVHETVDKLVGGTLSDKPGPMAQPTQQTAKIKGADGRIWTIPQENLQDALNRGATLVQ